MLVSQYAIYLGTLPVYRLYFHPLAKFPGPAWLIVSDLPYSMYHHLMGKFPTHVSPNLHRRYGKIVRIGPNRLSVDDSIGWVDIYTNRPGKNETEFRKKPKFLVKTGNLVVSAPDRNNYRRQRRVLAHAFNAAAIHEQEPIITYYVDFFYTSLIGAF